MSKEKDMKSYAKDRTKKLKSAGTPMGPAVAGDYKDPHQAKYDLDTMMRAEEVKQDSGRHRAAKKEGKMRMKALAKISIGGGKSKNAGKMGVKEA